MKRAGAAACALLSCALILLVLIAFAGSRPEPAYVFLYDSPDLDASGGLYTLTKVYVQPDNPEAPPESVVWFSSEKRFIYTIHADWLFLCVEEEKGCCSILKLNVQTGGQPTYILQNYDLNGGSISWNKHLFTYHDEYFYFLIWPELGSSLCRVARLHESGQGGLSIVGESYFSSVGSYTIDGQYLYCASALDDSWGLYAYNLESGTLHAKRPLEFTQIVGGVSEADANTIITRRAIFTNGQLTLQQNGDIAIYRLTPDLSLSQLLYRDTLPINPGSDIYPYADGLVYRSTDGYVYSTGNRTVRFWKEPEITNAQANGIPVSFFKDMFMMCYDDRRGFFSFVGNLLTGEWSELSC